jgi:hypothetical protein
LAVAFSLLVASLEVPAFDDDVSTLGTPSEQPTQEMRATPQAVRNAIEMALKWLTGPRAPSPTTAMTSFADVAVLRGGRQKQPRQDGQSRKSCEGSTLIPGFWRETLITARSLRRARSHGRLLDLGEPTVLMFSRSINLDNVSLNMSDQTNNSRTERQLSFRGICFDQHRATTTREAAFGSRWSRQAARDWRAARGESVSRLGTAGDKMAAGRCRDRRAPLVLRHESWLANGDFHPRLPATPLAKLHDARKVDGFGPGECVLLDVHPDPHDSSGRGEGGPGRPSP